MPPAQGATIAQCNAARWGAVLKEGLSHFFGQCAGTATAYALRCGPAEMVMVGGTAVVLMLCHYLAVNWDNREVHTR